MMMRRRRGMLIVMTSLRMKTTTGMMIMIVTYSWSFLSCSLQHCQEKSEAAENPKSSFFCLRAPPVPELIKVVFSIFTKLFGFYPDL